MPATPKKTKKLTFRQLLTEIQQLSMEEKQKLLAILQKELTVQDFTAKNKSLPKQKNYAQHPGLLIIEEEAATYNTPAKRKEKNLNAAIPKWQKQFVRKSINKHIANPELLITEKDAWKLIDRKK